MRFLDLQPAFIRSIEAGRFQEVQAKADAHGVMFLCPKCFEANGGPRGTHMVICWSRSAGAPESLEPGPGRWKMDGDLENLSLNADPPNTARSVHLTGPGCGWHGFITNGEAA